MNHFVRTVCYYRVYGPVLASCSNLNLNSAVMVNNLQMLTCASVPVKSLGVHLEVDKLCPVRLVSHGRWLSFMVLNLNTAFKSLVISLLLFMAVLILLCSSVNNYLPEPCFHAMAKVRRKTLKLMRGALGPPTALRHRGRNVVGQSWCHLINVEHDAVAQSQPVSVWFLA
jgi:hypothetical protein